VLLDKLRLCRALRWHKDSADVTVAGTPGIEFLIKHRSIKHTRVRGRTCSRRAENISLREIPKPARLQETATSKRERTECSPQRRYLVGSNSGFPGELNFSLWTFAANAQDPADPSASPAKSPLGKSVRLRYFPPGRRCKRERIESRGRGTAKRSFCLRAESTCKRYHRLSIVPGR